MNEHQPSVWRDLARVADQVHARLAARRLFLMRVLADGKVIEQVRIVGAAIDVQRSAHYGLQRVPKAEVVEVLGLDRNAPDAPTVRIVRLTANRESA